MTDEERAERAAEDERAMEAARELRARREAAQGPAPIDNKLHRELPLTRVAYGLFGFTILGFLVSRLAASMGSDVVEMYASIATTVLFLMTFVLWFASRHQAKKLTSEREQGLDKK